MNCQIVSLCNVDDCRRLGSHDGDHDPRPSEAWDFFHERDKKKLVKAGFATPRGGAKGAYQNHVVRTSRVIIPFERLDDVELNLYKNGYVVRLLPEQYFASPGQPRPEFMTKFSDIVIGQNAFVLYRTHDSFRDFPPLSGWQPRSLIRNGAPVGHRRGIVTDVGHYVLRLSRIGENPARQEGPPQGIFATEYADEDTNYLSKCVLAWLTIQTVGSPYTLTQGLHLRAILRKEGLDDANAYEYRGVLRHGLCCCPLCTRFIRYAELHQTITFAGEDAPANASLQVEGATRSTVANLFHIAPLVYHSLTHVPNNIAWGHAICNTHLGQRKCYSLAELIAIDRKVGIIREEGVESFGWISEDWQMIRSPNGAVWIQLSGDRGRDEVGPPAEPTFDPAAESPETAEQE